MENNDNNHLNDMYGPNPNMISIALQFPRLPPGLTHPRFRVDGKDLKNKISKDGDKINTKLEDFHQLFQKYASGLFEMSYPGVIPPGHPLYTRQPSIETLKSENSKLQKENLELKKQVEKLNKKN